MEGKPHIALIPYPAQGHIPPLIHLARKLAANGFIITLINIDSIHAKLSEKWSSPPHLDIRLRQVICDVKLPHGFSSEAIKDIDSILAAFERLENQAGELLRILEPPPCCLVVDFFLSWGARVAKSLNMCPVTYWPGNAAWSSVHQHLPDDSHFQGEIDELHVPGIESLKFEDLPDYFKMPLEAIEIRRMLIELPKDRMNDSEWTLVNSMMELEPQVFKAMENSLANKNFASVGPLFPLAPTSPLGVSLREEDGECLRWLDTQAEKSVLYISFGSIGTLPGEALLELAAGVEASGQPFLWVIRMDVVDESQEEMKEFVYRTRRQGLIVSWAPQVQVLSHSSVGGFLSHCGWNSTFESICHGVPILGWSLFTDQSLNCKVVTDLGIGKRLTRQLEVGREQVERMIRDFMQGEDKEKIVSRARSFKDMARKTVGEGGTSHDNLEKFMTAMKRRVR